VDELHRHRDLRLYRTWSGKLVKPARSLSTISTAGEPGSEFEETRADPYRGAEVTDETAAMCGRRRGHRLARLPRSVAPQAEDMDVVAEANPRRAITPRCCARSAIARR
jgi:hypothetical protein